MERAPHTPLETEELLAHTAFVRSIARGLVRDEAQVDDVVQQSFLRALKSPPRHRQNLRSWFAVVVRNVVYRDADSRRLRQDVQRGAARPEAAAEAADRATEQADFQRAVSLAVHELDEPFRTVIVLRFLEERSVDEVADLLGVPRETVRSRQRRGLARLRERLGREDERTGGDWRASALVLVGEDAWTGSASAPLAAATWMAAALLPLALIGGTVWWMVGGADDVGEPNLVLPADEAVASEAAGPDAAGHDANDARRAALPAEAAVSAGRVHARALAAEDGEPLLGARLVVARRTVDGWATAVVRSEADGILRATLTTAVVPPAEDDLAALRAPKPESFAVLRADGRVTLRIAPIPSAASSPAGDVDLGDLRLARGVPVRGRVVDHVRDAPLAGARLWLSDDRAGVAIARRAVPVGITGPDGRFELDEPLLPNGALPYTWTLFATHEGRAHWRDLLLDALDRAVEVELRVGPEASLELTVLGADGAPVRGARVLVLPLRPPWHHPDGGIVAPAEAPELSAPFEAVTDAKGRALLEALPHRDEGLTARLNPPPSPGDEAGPYGVRIEVPGGGGVLVADPLVLTLGETNRHVVHLGGLVAATSEGEVRSARDGRALPDARIRAAYGERELRVDTRGRFRPPSDFPRALVVDAPGHVPRRVEWHEAQFVPRVVVLEEERALRGRLVDGLGAPIAGLEVIAEVDEGPSARTATTGNDGEFVFAGLSAGPRRLRVRIPPDAPWREPEPRFFEAGADPIEWVLHADPRAGGEVVVHLIDPASGAPLTPLGARVRHVGGPPSAPPAVVLEAESVRITDLRPGSWRLWARVPGRGAALIDIEQPEAAPDRELVLPCAGFGRLRGRVALPPEAGVPRGWSVAAVFDGPPPPSGWTDLRFESGSRYMRGPVDEDGRFELETVVPGPYRLELHAPEWTATRRVTVPAGAVGEVELAPRRAGELLLRGSLPLPEGLSLWVSDGPGGATWHWLRPERVGAGWEARRLLPPGEGRWALGVRTPPESLRPLPPPRELASGNLRIEPGRTVVVEVPPLSKAQ